MSKRLLIRIDLARLRANISREEGRSVSADEVRQWLMDAGFTPADGGGWLVEEADLGQLDPSEVDTVDDAPEEKA